MEEPRRLRELGKKFTRYFRHFVISRDKYVFIRNYVVMVTLNLKKNPRGAVPTSQCQLRTTIKSDRFWDAGGHNVNVGSLRLTNGRKSLCKRNS